MKQIKQPLPFIVELGLGMLYKRFGGGGKRRERGRNSEMLDKTE